MSSLVTGIIVFGCLCGAGLFGIRLRALLPEHHLSAETKDTVKLAIGLVMTMSALLLGLLVASAKGTYDTERSEVIQMAAKVAFLNRMLTIYGPDAAEARGKLREAFAEAIQSIWSTNHSEKTQSFDSRAGDEVYAAIQRLSPRDDTQRSAKAQAASVAADVGQLRSLLIAQSFRSVSIVLLVVMVVWLCFVFLSFGLFAPRNSTAALAIVVSALSVAGAIFLMLELDQPLNGLIRISNAPMVDTLQRMAQ